MILWGVPGTGKSTFAHWLRDNKAFTHVDTDAVATGRAKPTALTEAWQGTYDRNLGARRIHRVNRRARTPGRR
jgi:adenylate kinase family enzyme